MPRAWVGMSGWTYEGWEGSFYPDNLSKKKQLEHASRRVNSIEINGTFYSLQRPTSFQSWHAQTPDKDFIFAVKAPQYITHVRRLKEVDEALANFFASGLLCLREKLGPILWQFPPFVMLKDDRFEKFFKLLPKNSKAAAKLAKQHGEKVEGRAFTEAKGDFPVRHAFEFRHKSFLNPDFMALMREHNIAFVFAHKTSEKAPYTEEPTADFVYARMHGEGYKKGYPDKEIEAWAKKVTAWKKAGLDAFTYFSTEAKVYSPHNAETLLKKLLVKPAKKKSA